MTRQTAPSITTKYGADQVTPCCSKSEQATAHYKRSDRVILTDQVNFSHSI